MIDSRLRLYRSVRRLLGFGLAAVLLVSLAGCANDPPKACFEQTAAGPFGVGEVTGAGFNGQTITFDASCSRPHKDANDQFVGYVAQYHWDLDGDGTFERITTTPTTTRSYDVDTGVRVAQLKVLDSSGHWSQLNAYGPIVLESFGTTPGEEPSSCNGAPIAIPGRTTHLTFAFSSAAEGFMRPTTGKVCATPPPNACPAGYAAGGGQLSTPWVAAGFLYYNPPDPGPTCVSTAKTSTCPAGTLGPGGVDIGAQAVVGFLFYDPEPTGNTCAKGPIPVPACPTGQQVGIGGWVAGGTVLGMQLRNVDVGGTCATGPTATSCQNEGVDVPGVNTGTQTVAGITFGPYAINPTCFVKPRSVSGPSISGIARAGETLTAHPGTWEGSTPMIFDYRWYQCDPSRYECDLLPHAVGSTYEVRDSDVGYRLKMTVVAHSVGGSDSGSAETDIVESGSTSSGGALVAPVAVAPPVVAGDAKEGATLTATAGTWVGADADRPTGYQWEACDAGGSRCEPIPGETRATHTVRTGEVATRLRVVVTRSNSAGETAARSEPTGTATPAFEPDSRAALDAPAGASVPYSAPGADSCIADPEGYPGAGYCGTDSESSSATAEASAMQFGLTHRSYGIADNWLTWDAHDATPRRDGSGSTGGMFGGPYLDPATSRTDCEQLNGNFAATDGWQRIASDQRFRDLGWKPSIPEPHGRLRKVRIIVPFDVMEGKRCTPADDTEQGRADYAAYRQAYYRVAEWITAAYANGKQVMVSFEKSVLDRRTQAGPPAIDPNDPKRAQTGYYPSAVATFLAEFEPKVTEYTAWNEPNNGIQPTSVTAYEARGESDRLAGAERAAKYYRELRSQCNVSRVGRCYVAAGDFGDPGFDVIDDPTTRVSPYFDRYADTVARGRNPSVWAFHAYASGHSRTAKAIQNLAYWTRKLTTDICPGSATSCPPRIWLTEQGGLVYERNQRNGSVIGARHYHSETFRSPSGETYAEALTRANGDLDYLLDTLPSASEIRASGETLPAAYAQLRGRITRFYYYDWSQGGGFHDSSLLEPQTGGGEPPNPNQGDARQLYTNYHDHVRTAPDDP